ncbi:hypothetical protein MVLG_00633 [Microbotryum lychnidis-dioicae p1A1 Lamole]|uniref:BTB domain-containing protein n=1 Tax=Microbotryum lychnidis-dioicae (strain p1A1 Lamole / MvSl-1064) TaxID=683840 RepID=U5GZN5_USTV1|nr:hypothetical protein MVLG_00633 [Microbotryum lychnidis-dioicae p1A1 Lamole]|eukprot:KDE09317.1 hypothetical protein MVLG_00633 [Microbotryum lychnidis-dioicae p1A1 Lamole]
MSVFSSSTGLDATGNPIVDRPLRYPWSVPNGVGGRIVPSYAYSIPDPASRARGATSSTSASAGQAHAPRFGHGFPALGTPLPVSTGTPSMSIPNQTRPQSTNLVGSPPVPLGVSPPPASIVSARSSPRPADRRTQSALLGGFTNRNIVQASGSGANSRRQSSVYTTQPGSTAGSIPRTDVQSRLSRGNGFANPLGEAEDAVNEWTFFGVEFTIADVAAHAEATRIATETESTSAGSANRDRQADHGSGAGSTGIELLSANFGGERWRVEFLRRQSPNISSKLTLFLSCHLLETSYSPDVIPTQLMLGIREPRQQASKRGGSETYLWRHWVDEFQFSHDNEFYETTELPSLQSLLDRSDRIRELDAFVLTVQIGSPIASFAPQIRDAHPVPTSLLAGVKNLVDDEVTGDVMIYVAECLPVVMRTPSDADETRSITVASTTVDSSAVAAPSTNFRKRVIYAHSAILKAQCSYFDSLLTEGWSETSVNQTLGMRRRSVLKIEDFDFNTVYTLLHYLYTDEIMFQDAEDVRSRLFDELPLGWLGPHPERLHWASFTVEEAEGWAESDHSLVAETSGRDDRPLSDIPETTDNRRSGKTGSPPPSRTQAKGRLALGISPVCPKPPISAGSDETIGAPPSPSRAMSAAGRISPLFGPPGRSPPSNSRPSTSRRSIGVGSHSIATESASGHCDVLEPTDPHPHSAGVQEPASALSMYRIAHRYCHPVLQKLALEQIVYTLTPRTAFPMLLSNYLWPEVYEVVKSFTLEHFELVSADPEFDRCYAEVGEGLWEHGGAVLLDLTRSLRPATPSRWSS